LLAAIETALGDDTATARARDRAVEVLLAYRRGGGAAPTSYGIMCTDLRAALVRGQADDFRRQFSAEFEAMPRTDGERAFAQALLRIIGGDRGADIADNPALEWDAVAELRFLLEALSTA
jgi:hypothetical protein